MSGSSFNLISKGKIILLTLLMLNIGLIAQKIEVSTPLNYYDNTAQTTVIGQNETGLYILRQDYKNKTRNISIDVFYPNKTTELKKSVVFIKEKEDFALQLFLTKKELLLFYGHFDKSNGIDYLKVKRLNDQLESNKTDSVLFTFKDKKIDLNHLIFERNKLLKSIFIMFPKDDEPNQLNYKLLNDTLKLIKEGNFAIQEDKYQIKDVAHQERFASFLTLINEPEANAKENKPNYHYVLNNLDITTNQITQTKLQNDSLFAIDAYLKSDLQNKRIICGGISKVNESYYTGFYGYNTTLDHLTPTLEYYPFTNQIRKNASKQKLEDFYSLRTIDIIPKVDGGIIFTAEEFHSSKEVVPEMNINGFNQVSYRYYFIYNNILVQNQNKNGNQEWSKIIRKEQSTINDDGAYSSFIAHQMKDKIIFLYNDFSRKNTSLMAYILYPDGSDDTKIIVKPQEYKFKLLPRDGGQISPEEILLPGFTNKGLIHVKIGF
jgi:hypothetical protein